MNVIIYPGGTGGRWLSNLIGSLENGTLMSSSGNAVNFHKNYFHGSLQISHSPTNDHTSLLMPSEQTVNSFLWIKKQKYWKLFSTERTFNVWINNVKKFVESENQRDYNSLSDLDKVLFLKSKCYKSSLSKLYQLAYTKDIDLEYNFIFKNPELFADQLFEILTLFNIKFVPDKDIVLDGIEKFILTAVNPETVVGDINNLSWLGWSLALLKRNGVDIGANVDSLDELKDSIATWQNWCISQSAPYILEI